MRARARWGQRGVVGGRERGKRWKSDGTPPTALKAEGLWEIRGD